MRFLSQGMEFDSFLIVTANDGMKDKVEKEVEDENNDEKCSNSYILCEKWGKKYPDKRPIMGYPFDRRAFNIVSGWRRWEG
jgi:hypothetical protein